MENFITHAKDGYYDGIVFHRVIDDVPLAEQGRQQLREIMSLPNPPSVVLCSYDIIAMNVIDECKKLNIRVPEQLSITGFGDTFYYVDLFDLFCVLWSLSACLFGFGQTFY